jgi:hypothetical protein
MLRDWHSLTHRLANTEPAEGIEGLYMAGMLKHRQLAQAISGMGFAVFRRQLAYRPRWYGRRIIVADRTSACRNPERPAGGLAPNRDLNVAQHLEQRAGSSPNTPHAWGEEITVQGHGAQWKLPAVQQEPNTCDSLAEERGTSGRTEPLSESACEVRGDRLY